MAEDSKKVKVFLKPDANSGFAVGVVYWLLLMLLFAVLGYAPFLSICYGAIGGLAGGVIAAWWNAKEDDDAPKKSLEEAIGEEPKPKPKPLPKSRKTRDRGRVGMHRRRRYQTDGQRRFGWLFRRTPKQ